MIETITRDPRAWRPALEELDLEQYARFFGEKGFPRTANAVGWVRPRAGPRVRGSDQIVKISGW